MFINKYLFLETLFYLISKITHNMQKKTGINGDILFKK